jgi:hypothetical protein
MVRLHAGLVAVACTALAGRAEARPQYSMSGQIGVVGRGDGDRAWSRTRLDLGVRAEALFGRSNARDFGLGPYAEARTASFAHGDYGGGLVALLPVDMTFPLWCGVGAFGRREEGAWAPGGNAFVGWGSRSFNHHADYGMAYGLLVDARVVRGDRPGFDLIVAATIDLQAVALPFVIAFEAIRH